MQIVLYRPEIAPNTGNIARTCSLVGASLLLIPPMGFFLKSPTIKRSCVNYVDPKNIEIWENGENAWIEQHYKNCWMFSTQGQTLYTEVEYEENPILLFGSESSGLPQSWIELFPSRLLKIPFIGEKRSLNLSNAVAIAMYEVLRQQNFKNLIH